MTDLNACVRTLAEPLARAHELDLVDVAVRGEGRARLVRVIVDRKGGMDLATCEAVSKALGAELDAADTLDAGYRLEVTSPGVDYPLRGRRAFERVEGREVRVQRVAGLSPGELRGTVLGADDEKVTLGIEGDVVGVAYREIAKAVQCLPW